MNRKRRVLQPEGSPVWVLVPGATSVYVGGACRADVATTPGVSRLRDTYHVPSLRILREQRYMTQEQLASAAEVSSSTVHNAETGKRQPRPAILRRLARALEVAPGDIDFPVPQVKVM